MNICNFRQSDLKGVCDGDDVFIKVYQEMIWLDRKVRINY
jgi:hypothetical protein